MEAVANIKERILKLKKNDELSLIKKAIAGNRDCFSELIKSHKIYLYKMAYSYVKNEDQALEILQECSYRSMLNIGKLKNPSYFKTWITRIVINCSLDFLKSINSQSHLNDEVLIKVIDYSISIDEKLDLYNAIDLLKDNYKTVIILKYFNDMTLENISNVMDIPENTVKTYLKRAKASLSNILREEYLND